MISSLSIFIPAIFSPLLIIINTEFIVLFPYISILIGVIAILTLFPTIKCLNDNKFDKMNDIDNNKREKTFNNNYSNGLFTPLESSSHLLTNNNTLDSNDS